MVTKFSRKELKKLRQNLPHGAINDIVKATGLTRQSVRKVLAGEWHNEAVIEEAMKLLEKSIAEKEQKLQRIEILTAAR
jgi:20S proteasome alpha/beta subunit